MAEKTKYLNQIELEFLQIVSEDRVRYVLKSESPFPEYEEIDFPEKLRNPEEIATDLHSIDWAFTKDDTGFIMQPIVNWNCSNAGCH